jgi:hypothetical protein
MSDKSACHRRRECGKTRPDPNGNGTADVAKQDLTPMAPMALTFALSSPRTRGESMDGLGVEERGKRGSSIFGYRKND